MRSDQQIENFRNNGFILVKGLYIEPYHEGFSQIFNDSRMKDMVFDSFVPLRSGPNLTDQAKRVLYVTYNPHADGDQRRQYYADKRKTFPPDCERDPDKEYVFRV